MKKSILIVALFAMNFAFAQSASAFNLGDILERYGISSEGTATADEVNEAASQVSEDEIPENVQPVRDSLHPDALGIAWQETSAPGQSCGQFRNDDPCVGEGTAYLAGELQELSPECKDRSDAFLECRGVDPNDSEAVDAFINEQLSNLQQVQ